LKEQLKRLRELQYIDLELDGFRKVKGEIVERIEENKGFLSKLIVDLEKQKEEFEEIKSLQRSKSDDLTYIKEQHDKRKKRLHNVGSAKEFNAVEKEIEGLKRSIGQTEEELQHMNEVIQSTQDAIADKESKVVQLQKSIAAEEAASADQIQKADDDIERLKARESEARGEVSKRVLHRYDFIRNRREGLAVVAAKDGYCEACYMAVPAQEFIMIQRGTTLCSCPHCQCILYFWEEAIGEPGGPSADA